MSAESPDDATIRTVPDSARPDVQRRRREVALTQRWLRELRGIGTRAGARPTARFARPVKH